MNEALFYCIIQDSNPLIIQIKRSPFMFILRDLLRPLQAHFSDTDLGRERSSLFAYTLLAVIVPVHIVHNVQFTAFPG